MTEPHAVRWMQRQVQRSMDEFWSKWHWTNDASWTVCGRAVQLIAEGDGPMLPEHDDSPDRVTCTQCKRKMPTI